MAKSKPKFTPGQKLLLGLHHAIVYDQQAEMVDVPPGATGRSPERATKRWLEGMSRHLKNEFSAHLRELREELRLTQQGLADIADLTVTAVAMAERGERAPSLDTAMRLCWALDVKAGVTLEDLA
jgi:DNA-binding XRE family transcriptional regulator